MFLLRLGCCSHWPPWCCFVTQTCLLHFLLQMPYPTSVLTSTRLSPYTACIWRWTSMGRIFSTVDNGMLFETHILTAFYFNWHWTGVMDRCGFKAICVGGEISHDCVELVLCSFPYSKKMWQRRQHFLAHPCSWAGQVVRFVCSSCMLHLTPQLLYCYRWL